MSVYRLLGTLLLSALSVTAAQADPHPKQAQSLYVFGNSLVNHLSETDIDTNVPVWLARLAKADGRTLKLDGQWGFVRNFADELPPKPNWSFPGVTGAWNARRQRFASAGFTGVMMTPANFIQYQEPDRPYDGDNPRGESPIDASLRLFDWIAREIPQTPFYIYEGWAEMGTVAGRFPPSNRGLRKFHAYNQGEYHDWFTTYVDGMSAARPGLDIRLIPVASTLSYLLTQDELSGIAVTDLYEDDAPHGRQTLYFLAAMITYSALYEAPPPASIDLPDTIHATVRENYGWIADQIWQRISPGFASAQAPVPASAARSDHAAIPAPEGAPALAMGLNGIADWSSQNPFVNAMKSARPWIGHIKGQWGGVEAKDLRAAGALDENGWPLRVPDTVTKLETFLFADQSPDDGYLPGTWLVRYEGKGDLEIGGRARNVRLANGEGRFTLTPGDGLVSVALNQTDPDDPIRNIAIFREDQLPLYEAGVLFNPDWIAVVENLRSVRFMDWMLTNGSETVSWDDRPKMDDFSWVEKGVPLPVMVALANQLGADPWFNMPHKADDAYVREFSRYVRDTLDPRLIAYVEYSNEVWNFIFPQALFAQEQATALWGRDDSGWMEYYGLRAAQVMDIWTDVFGGTDRLMRVAATHTGWQGLEELILTSGRAEKALGHKPQDSFDGYAITGYFGFEMGGDENAPQMKRWLDTADAAARKAGRAQGLTGAALDQFVEQEGYTGANAPVAAALRTGSVKEMTEVIFPYHARAARTAGLQLLMYEGGTHVAAHGSQMEDERITAFFTQFNYSAEMAAIYETLLKGWEAAGGRMFNAFVDVSLPTKWGSWGALRTLTDANPRFDALMAYSATGNGDWQNRSPGAFDNGLRLTGTDAADTLTGGPEEDILLAGAGEDVLISNGGSDHLHGGDGIDTGVLPLTVADYRFSLTPSGITAQAGRVTVTLASVEYLEFSDGVLIETALLSR